MCHRQARRAAWPLRRLSWISEYLAYLPSSGESIPCQPSSFLPTLLSSSRSLRLDATGNHASIGEFSNPPVVPSRHGSLCGAQKVPSPTWLRSISCRSDPRRTSVPVHVGTGIVERVHRNGSLIKRDQAALNRYAYRAKPTAADRPASQGCRWSAACRRRRSSWRRPGSTAPAPHRSSRAARPTGARAHAAS